MTDPRALVPSRPSAWPWRRKPVPEALALAALGTVALAVAGVACLPVLVATPSLGGPLVALGAGVVGWSSARLAAPRRAANDDAPRAPRVIG